MDDKIKKSFGDVFKSEEETVRGWMKKTKEDMALQNWLKKAKAYENANDYKRALESYLHFIELKLTVIKSSPDHTLEDFFGLVPYYIKIGDCYKNISHYKKEDRLKDFEKAAEYYKKAANMYLELKDYTSASVYFEFASKTYEETELYEKAAECIKEIAEMYLNLENTLLAGTSYVSAGTLYEKGGNYDNAFESYLKSAELSSGMGDINAAVMSYKKVADIRRTQGRHEEAIKYYVSAAEMSTQLERYLDVARTYVGIAQNYEETGNLEEAAFYYLKSAEISLDNDPEFASKSFKNTAKCYRKMKRYDVAIGYYTRSADISIGLKNHVDAAENYWGIAECYKILEDREHAADFYVKYSEHVSFDKSKKEYLEGYRRSAELYSEVGDMRLKENKFDEAAKCYKKSAASYDNLENYSKSGGFYLKAGLIEKDNNLGDFFKTLTVAAEKYEKADELYSAAECYLEVNEYSHAAKSFMDYADRQLDNEDFFYAGEGYRLAGMCYSELNQKDAMLDSYDKAIQDYLKYVDKLSKLGLTKDNTSNAGRAYKETAESYRLIGNLINAQKYFKSAVDYFNENNMKDEAILTNAFLSKVSAKLSLQRGDYTLASDLSSTSIKNFGESIAKGGWNKRYLKFLEDNEKEARKILYGIGEKPEITLVMDSYTYSFVDMPNILNMTLTNEGNQPVSDITLLSQLPEEFGLIKPPDPIKELMIKESIKDFIELTTKKPGKYRIKPLEVLYKDTQGNKYVKSSNTVLIEIVEKPVIDYRNYVNTAEAYKKYADTQLKNNSHFPAGEGYKMVAECYREFIFKRSGDSKNMGEYYRKAIDSYIQYIRGLGDTGKLSLKQLSQLADASFKIGDCCEAMGDPLNSEKYLNESIKIYALVIERTQKDNEKLWFKLRSDVVDAFLSRVKARSALENKNYETARELLERSINIFEDMLEKRLDVDYEDFLKRNNKDTRDLLTGITGKSTEHI